VAEQLKTKHWDKLTCEYCNTSIWYEYRDLENAIKQMEKHVKEKHKEKEKDNDEEQD